MMDSKSTRKRKAGKKPKNVKVNQIWCHLCKVNFEDYEVFRLHIMKKHRPTSQFYEGDTDSDSSENTERFANKVHTYSKDHEFEMDSDENEDLFNIDSEENTVDGFSQAIGESNCNENVHNISETPVSSHTRNTESDKDAKNKNVIHPKSREKTSNQANQTPQINATATNQQNNPSNNFMGPQYVVPNNQLFASPFLQQPMVNSYFGGNQPMVQYTPMVNPVTATGPLVNIPDFVFNAKNITRWHNKLKKMCEAHESLPPKLLKKMKTIKKIITDNCNFVGINTTDDKFAVLKVYEELIQMIHTNINSTNETL